MLAIFKKELNTFFASPIGYLVIAVFLLVNGLFLWVFKGDFNILNAGFSDLTSFFYLSPWLFIFLIPAITMRSFSDEIKKSDAAKHIIKYFDMVGKGKDEHNHGAPAVKTVPKIKIKSTK